MISKEKKYDSYEGKILAKIGIPFAQYVTKVVALRSPSSLVELESCCTNHLVKVTKRNANRELGRNSPFAAEKGARKFRQNSQRDTRLHVLRLRKDPNSKICLYNSHIFPPKWFSQWKYCKIHNSKSSVNTTYYVLS